MVPEHLPLEGEGAAEILFGRCGGAAAGTLGHLGIEFCTRLGPKLVQNSDLYLGNMAVFSLRLLS